MALHHPPHRSPACSRSVAPGAGLVQIRPAPRGSLASLACQPVDASEAAARLKPDEVLVAVKAVGINFRWAQGRSWSA